MNRDKFQKTAIKNDRWKSLNNYRSFRVHFFNPPKRKRRWSSSITTAEWNEPDPRLRKVPSYSFYRHGLAVVYRKKELYTVRYLSIDPRWWCAAEGTKNLNITKARKKCWSWKMDPSGCGIRDRFRKFRMIKFIGALDDNLASTWSDPFVDPYMWSWVFHLEILFTVSIYLWSYPDDHDDDRR